MDPPVPEPVTVEPWFSPRIWGTRDLAPYYPPVAPEAEPVGEAWLTAPHCRLSGAEEELSAWWERAGAAWSGATGAVPGPFPWLIKLLFPRDYLSVQVHPDDGYAAAHGLGRGKTEMWHVLAAEPGAKLGLGLRDGASLADLAAACRGGGRAADLLRWIEPAPGETFFIPAGTVHAMGPGLVIAEVQQPSDNTFRLDDYGRRDAGGKLRELHLDAGLAVARERTAAGRVAPAPDGWLLRCRYFSARRIELRRGQSLPLPSSLRVLVSLAGELRLAGGHALPRAQAVVLPLGPATLAGEGLALEVTPGDPA